MLDGFLQEVDPSFPCKDYIMNLEEVEPADNTFDPLSSVLIVAFVWSLLSGISGSGWSHIVKYSLHSQMFVVRGSGHKE